MRKWTRAALAGAVGLLLLSVSAVRADVKPNGLISDGMVLQRGMPVPIWGTADNDEEVTVKFGDQEKKVTAHDGKWMVVLDKLEAGGPHQLTIRGKNTIEVKDVLVGEVWICSGQSNMEMSVASSADAQKNIENSKNSKIHLFTVPKSTRAEPQHNVQGKWEECGPDTVKNFSAVGYFFGRDLQKDLDVPIGLIHTSWGGTPAEAWTSRAGLEAHPELRYYAQEEESLRRYAGSEADDPNKALSTDQEYQKVQAKAKEAGQALAGHRAHFPSALYNGMIAPLIPYAIKGAIWYQGESNAGKAYEYRTLFPAMIQSWRDAWKEGDFPFLFVQLAPFAAGGKPQGPEWAELREAQLLTTQKLPHTGMAVITDVGDERDIHPKQKEPVGHRLALTAEALAYHKDIVYSGPVYDSMKVEGDRVLLTFKHVDGGLVARGGPLQGFTIAGEDQKFVKAEAEIRDDKVEVWSKEVDKPVAVRYGWANFPVCNLANKEGLPATPFRTDDFPLTTNPHKPKAASGASGS